MTFLQVSNNIERGGTIMKLSTTVFLTFIIFSLMGCTIGLNMSPPAKLDMAGIQQHPSKAGLLLSKELKENVYVKQTSPFDSISYPLGEQTAQIFQKNLPLVFSKVVEIQSRNDIQDVDLIVEPSIVNFSSVIPMPAYNPYTAKIVYRVDIYNKKNEKIFTQTVAGDAQSSKGLMSGFSARNIAADVAQKAMENAIKQILEGLSAAEELKKF
jgi:hypothetical protein